MKVISRMSELPRNSHGFPDENKLREWYLFHIDLYIEDVWEWWNLYIKHGTRMYKDSAYEESVSASYDLMCARKLASMRNVT